MCEHLAWTFVNRFSALTIRQSSQRGRATLRRRWPASRSPTRPASPCRCNLSCRSTPCPNTRSNRRSNPSLRSDQHSNTTRLRMAAGLARRPQMQQPSLGNRRRSTFSFCHLHGRREAIRGSSIRSGWYALFMASVNRLPHASRGYRLQGRAPNVFPNVLVLTNLGSLPRRPDLRILSDRFAGTFSVRRSTSRPGRESVVYAHRSRSERHARPRRTGTTQRFACCDRRLSQAGDALRNTATSL